MRISELTRQISTTLTRSDCAFGQGGDDADDEALWIIYAGLGLDFAADIEQGIDRSDQELACRDLETIQKLLDERVSTRRPLAYILNETWFCSHRFYIDERAIIPRSYLSEWIPDQFQPWIDPGKTHRILDLCTGSGCIAVSCALAFPEATVLASDISEDALEVATENIALYGLGNRVSINLGDRFQGVDERFDLIVCNPPYVSDARMEKLPGEFRKEPELAFRGGERGLDFIIPMLREAASHLTKSGYLVVEAGSASHALEDYYPDIPFTWLSTAHDETVVFIISACELEQFQRAL